MLHFVYNFLWLLRMHFNYISTFHFCTSNPPIKTFTYWPLFFISCGCMHVCIFIYIYIPKYTCWVHTMLFECRFSSLIIWHQKKNVVLFPGVDQISPTQFYSVAYNCFIRFRPYCLPSNQFYILICVFHVHITFG